MDCNPDEGAMIFDGAQRLLRYIMLLDSQPNTTSAQVKKRKSPNRNNRHLNAAKINVQLGITETPALYQNTPYSTTLPRATNFATVITH
jgi:hypothetical protein